MVSRRSAPWTATLAAAAAAVLAGACAADIPRQLSDAEIETRAREIHQRVITLDTHADIPFNFATPEVDPGVRGNRQVDLPKMREGGLDVAFFIVYVGQGPRTPEGYQNAIDGARTKFAGIRRMTYELYPDQVELAYTADDVERIWRSGKLVAAIGIENGYAVGQDLSLLEEYHRLGARYAGLVHNGHNDIADSTNPRPQLGDEEEEHGGLSEFGREYVRELNRLGIMVDVSHASRKAMLEAARVSRAPIIASHSSTSAVADVSRNMNDEQLLALEENGGVMQTVALRGFVKVQPPERAEAIAALRERFGLPTGGGGGALAAALRELPAAERADFDEGMAEIQERWPDASVADFVDHIDHAVRLIGIDHVGISSDFDGGGGVVGWDDASETLNVTIELVRRGYTEEEIGKLWSGNLLRVWREVERVAAEMRAAN
jgi:membrane dipeptidase